MPILPLNFDNKSIVAASMGRAEVPPSSFSGTDCHITAFVPPDKSANPEAKAYKKFGEITTITMSSHRGVMPVRALGEHWVRDYTRGTRTVAGTLVFSVLEKDVFADLYQLDKREGNSPYPPFIDQIPPFTIGIHALTEFGQEASMFIWGVQLSNWGMAVSTEDLYIECTYSYVAKWVTPFLSGTFINNLEKVRNTILSMTEKKASDLFEPKKAAGF